MKNKKLVLVLLLSFLAAVLAGCDLITSDIGGGKNSDKIRASGVIEAVQISIASELSGRISEILVEESAQVTAGELVFVLEDDLLLTAKNPG